MSLREVELRGVELAEEGLRVPEVDDGDVVRPTEAEGVV